MRTVAAALILCCPLFADEKPTEADARAKIEAWKEAVKAGTDEAKSAAINGLAECRHSSTAVTLMQIACSETEELRIAAAKGLGKWKGDSDAAKALLGSVKANEKKPAVYGAVFGAMAEVEHPSSIAAVQDLVRKWDDDEDVGIATAAIGALGGFRMKAAVEALLDIWQKNKVGGRGSESKIRNAIRDACNKSMRRLLGEKFESLTDAEDWWKDNRGKLKDDLTAR